MAPTSEVGVWAFIVELTDCYFVRSSAMPLRVRSGRLVHHSQSESHSEIMERNEMTNRAQWLGLCVFLCICLGAAGLGAVATTPEIDGWYATLAKPTWNPPNWIFGPVWTTLYILMAIAAWLVWRPAGFQAANLSLILFAIQLCLNVGWSWIFFGLHQPGGALVEIVLLWLAIAATTRSFFYHSVYAGWLMIPYLAWVSFATVLNFAIWRLN